MNSSLVFENEKKERISNFSKDTDFKDLSLKWLKMSMQKQYVYNFNWLGRPIIQYPQDMIAVQELIWNVKPDLIIETGIAHGGSLILSASMLALLDIKESNSKFNRRVLGIDIDIREHNFEEINNHPLSFMIHMIEGSSVDENIVNQVQEYAKPYKKIMVFLDSMHTHEHVLNELNLYSPLVSHNSYCVVFDTFIEDINEDIFPNRPWSKGNNPMTAIHDFLLNETNFEIDKTFDNKLMISAARNGFLKRVS